MFAHLVDNYREMIAAELLEPLVVGQTYYGSFWINAAYGGSQYIGSACNNMGMLMWTTLNLATWQPNSPRPVLRNYAQVYSQQVIADTAGWSLVSGSFVADSAYRYVVVGNHFDNANTTVQVIGPGNPNEAYVFVDALCLSTDPDGCPMATSIRESNAGVIGLWPNPVSEWLRIRWGRLSVHSVIVVDAVGRRVVEQLVLGGQELTLAVHELRNGSYNLLLEGEGGKETRKFVVMR
ncbi:MAG: T9SS type A sorting domain-containing protein [Flavobacteriales bacterium]|nr:T9SS type A sorting domain-containing protein [Flavobacteriales bacterium]